MVAVSNEMVDQVMKIHDGDPYALFGEVGDYLMSWEGGKTRSPKKFMRYLIQVEWSNIPLITAVFKQIDLAFSEELFELVKMRAPTFGSMEEYERALDKKKAATHKDK